MANTTEKLNINKTNSVEQKLQAVQAHGKQFLKARKGEIKLSVSDINTLSDLTEIFFGERITNISQNIRIQPWVDRKGYNSELIINSGDGIYKLYSQVSSYQLQQQLGQ